jgi:hypothetical protein
MIRSTAADSLLVFIYTQLARCADLLDVLIIQESNKPEPDDSAAGGNLTFTFGEPVLFQILV